MTEVLAGKIAVVTGAASGIGLAASDVYKRQVCDLRNGLVAPFFG